MARASTLLFFAIAIGCGASNGNTTPNVADGGSVTPGVDGATPPAPGPGPSIAGCNVFPADNDWNRDVSADPVDPKSNDYIANMAPTGKMHADWGAEYGIPWITVPPTEPLVPATFTYDDESDKGPYPIPLTAPIEGGPSSTGDRHVLALQTGTCILWELYAAYPQASSWKADSGAKFDLKSNALRPDGWTSTDAAGLPVLPGLVRFDEVKAGKIAHAVRFTMVNTQKAYIHPATHHASSKTDPNLPPMGIRVRLKASVDISGFKPEAKVVATAMKTYGLLLADNGSNWYVTGDQNPGWTDEIMENLNRDLGKLTGNSFEIVKTGEIRK